MNNLAEYDITLLLIEDDVDFSTSLVARFEKTGMKVIAVFSAEEALDKLKSNIIDVIVADIKLTGMDGMQFLTKVRTKHKDLPVIMLTGYGSLESAQEAVKLNAADYLLKPLENIHDLLDPIHKAVHSYRLGLENKQLLFSLQMKIDELAISERKFRNLFESSGDIIFVIDIKGKITVANSKMRKVTASTNGDLVGTSAFKVVVSMEDGEYKSKFKKVLKGEPIKPTKVKITNKHKKTCLGEMGMTPIVDDGNITGVQCVIRDTSECEIAKRSLEMAFKKLQETQDQLSQSAKMEVMGQMASGFVHDVKNPLAVITQGIQYLEKKVGQKSEKTSEAFDMIERSIERADNIVNTLLDFSRGSKLDIESNDINSLLETSLFLIKHQLREKDITVIKKFGGKLPKVMIDERRIEQVLVNLLLNAIQAMENEGKITIRTFLQELEPLKETTVAIEISDTGDGISSDNLEKVFDPFFTTKSPGKGTGLGLVIAKNIINVHKGHIKIKSTENEGTKVTINLKLAK